MLIPPVIFPGDPFYRLHYVESAISIRYSWNRLVLLRRTCGPRDCGCAVVSKNGFWRGLLYVVIEHPEFTRCADGVRLMRYAVMTNASVISVAVIMPCRLGGCRCCSHHGCVSSVSRVARLAPVGLLTRLAGPLLFVPALSADKISRFIREVAHRVPQHRERLMTIAERLQEVGRRKGKREGRRRMARRAARRGAANCEDDACRRYCT